VKPSKLNGHPRTVTERYFECPLCLSLVAIPPTAGAVWKWRCPREHGGRVNLGWHL
jgi:hypothetical protein